MSLMSSFFALLSSSSPASNATESAPPETATITVVLLSGNSRPRQAVNSRRANELNLTRLDVFDFGGRRLGVIDLVIAAYARARARGQPICGILALIGAFAAYFRRGLPCSALRFFAPLRLCERVDRTKRAGSRQDAKSQRSAK